MPITREKFIELHPTLFHVSLAGWDQIQQHGLLSTSALLDLFEYDNTQRFPLESRKRPERVQLHHPVHGNAWLNDQKPLHENILAKSCPAAFTPQRWIEYLNRRVFFWPSTDRLNKLHNARAARQYERIVVQIKTQDLLDHFGDRVELSPINSGATFPLGSAPRVEFLPLGGFPFDFWSQKRGSGKKAIVEVTVPDAMNKPELLSIYASDQRSRPEVLA